MCLQNHLSHDKEKGHHIGRYRSVFSRDKHVVVICRPEMIRKYEGDMGECSSMRSAEREETFSQIFVGKGNQDDKNTEAR